MLATLTDAENNKTTYEYDGFDRLSRTMFPMPTRGANQSNPDDDEHYTYDPNGNLASLQLRDGNSIAFTHDALDRLTLKDLPGTGYTDRDRSFEYDNLSRMTKAVAIGDRTSLFAWDALGRKLTEKNGGNAQTVSTWDAAGRRTRLTYPDGFFVDYDYLVTGETTKIRENGATSGTGVLATFAYDNLGLRTSLTRGNGTVTSYTFDPVSRLASLTQNLTGSASDLVIDQIAYNPASQITGQRRAPDAFAWTGHADGTIDTTPNGLNQLTSAGGTALGYDARGNLISNGSRNYRYDSENRLTADPGVTYLRGDGLGRLYLYSDYQAGISYGIDYDGLELISENSNRFVHGPGIDEPLVWYDNGVRRFLHADERGSIVAVSDDAGALVGINRYDEFGVPQEPLTGRFGYTGQLWLPLLSMYHYKFRVYDPKLGRFLQPDPIGYLGGMNLYAYVGNDPINFVDPLGLDHCKPDEDPNNVEVCGHGLPDPDPFAGIIPHRLRVDFDLGLYSDTIIVTGRRIRRDVTRRIRSAFCAIPSLGWNTGVDAYAVFGGTIQSGVAIDLRTGGFSFFFSTGVGLGVGGGPFTQYSLNAPTGVSAALTANLAASAGLGASGSYTLLGENPGSWSGGAVRSGPNFGANANIAA